MKTLSIAALLAVLLCTAAPAQDNIQRIQKRAAEIEAFLPAKPIGIGRPITDRTAWNAIPKGNIIAQAEKTATTPIPDLPEELYKEFYRNGNRSNYQNVYFTKVARVSAFALAEGIENKGRFIKPLEETIRSLCADKSWVLPAHDTNAEIYDGKNNFIDLFSSNISSELALAVYWLGDKLSPEVQALVRDNIQRRTFASYEETAPIHSAGNGKSNWWITGTNNWNTVCHANVVCAALALIESPQKRAWYIACSEQFMTPFFEGFTPDGYCSEGMGYWNYGFGHFAMLAEIVCQATGGNVDFFTMPKVKNCSLFGPRMEVAPGQFAAFADCSISAKPSPILVKFLSKRLQLGYANYEKEPNRLGNLKETGVYCFANSADKTPKAATAAASPLTELRTQFSDAGILICRNPSGGKQALNFVCKAGHNNEHHNHNDVGSFTVMYAGTLPVLDPGGEVYTRRTFSGKRYDSKLLNSFGHPVPVINGQLQRGGRSAEGKVITQTFTDEKDTVLMDITAAYGQKEIKSLKRQFEYFRNENKLVITDSVDFVQPGTVEAALVTYEPFELLDKDAAVAGEPQWFSIGAKDKQVMVAVNAASTDERSVLLTFASETIDEDASAGKKPTRLGFKIDGKVHSAVITTVIETVATR